MIDIKTLEHPIDKYYVEYSELTKNTERKKFIRRKLWEDQGGKCCFCECGTTLPEVIPDDYLVRGAPPDRMATIEHIDSRFYVKRVRKKDYSSKHRLAVSCYRCNQIRDKIEKGNRQLFKKYGHLFKGVLHES